MRTMENDENAWIGDIPDKWSLERLKFHACFNPVTVPPAYSDDDQVSFIPMDHLKSGFHSQIMVPFSKVKKGYVSFAEDDILMAKVTPCMENGNLAIATGLINGIGFGSTEINVIRCQTINNKYLFYLLQCPSYIDKATYNMFGVAGLKRLNPEFIPNSVFPIPSPYEQLKITSFLDEKCKHIDSLITVKEKTNALLKEHRQSIIYEAVTKGLNPDIPMKDSGIEWIGQIPENWSVYRLKYLLSQVKDSIKAGPFGSSLTSSDMQGNDVKVFNQRSVLDNDFEAGDEYVSVEKSLELKGFIAKEGDVLITTRGTIGKTAIVPRGKQGILHPCLIKMVIDDNVFLKTLLCRIFNETNMLTEQLRLASNATTIDVIYTQNLLNLYIPVPPIEAQEAIEKFLCKECGELDKLISFNESSIQKLKEYRQSLIYEAVTGKMEV